MHVVMRFPRRGCWKTVAAPFFLLSVAFSGAGAQEQTDESRLATRVQLALGKATLAQVMSALSTQTGLAVEASDYLLERELIVQMQGLTARAALDALCELNDWTWRRTSPGHYRLDVRRLTRPQSIAELVEEFVAAFPKDFRRFLGVDVPLEEYVEKPLPYDLRKSFEQAPYFQIERQIKLNAGQLQAAEQRWLSGSFAASIPIDVRFPYSRFSPEQKRRLLFFLVSDALVRSRASLFQKRLQPYQIDPANAVVEFKRDGDISINSYDEHGRRSASFGAVLSAYSPLNAPPTPQ